MKKKLIIGGLLCVSLFLVGCSNSVSINANQNNTDTNKDITAPKVIDSFPKTGAQDVDPTTATIWVKFDESMMDNGWSWAYDQQDQFPASTGNPSYSEDNTINTLPVKLEPNHEYDIWVNSDTLKDFKDRSGNSAEPFELKFKTK